MSRALHTNDNLESDTGRNARDNGLGHDNGNSYISDPNHAYDPAATTSATMAPATATTLATHGD